MARPLSARLGASYPATAGRRFGLTIGLAFMALSALARWRGHPTPSVMLGALGAAAIAAAFIVPAKLGPVEAAWMRLARAISRLTTPLFMGIVYFIVLTPTALLRRRLGGSELTRRRGADGYWVDRTATQRSSLTRQF